ncbi:MAG: penicillin-insensitive murein endopeptidase [Syntrophobacteraceae bacterium]|nr:penicillin-insensitive murein endopeptidase [Syntrophobacteraceae bacterium]
MRQVLRWPKSIIVFSIPLILLSIPLTPDPSQAITASIGQPYHGRLVNGIPFPRQFSGYQLREDDRTYATPEVIGAMLDAIDTVQKQFPGIQSLYFGDFSLPNGGAMGGHRSHQNGRDVDVGMYAKGNRTLDRFLHMNEENLDVPRTWAFIESLLCSQRVQYIFVDRRIQDLLHDYARSRGMDTSHLDRLFANNRGAVIQHVRNHSDHIHIRFYTPWSTMAARVSELDDQKRAVIEMAQQSYLPKKVFYYANGNEKSLDALARSFGVQRSDLCRWNELRGNEILSPGKSLVFYKRGFEFEPVHLAQSLQPDSVPETSTYHYAALRPASSTVTDAVSTPREPSRERARQRRDKPSSESVTFTTKAKRGDTIEKIARRNGIDAAALARANGVKVGRALKPGQKIKLVGMKLPAGAASCEVTGSRKGAGGSSTTAVAKVSPKSSTARSVAGSASSRSTASKSVNVSSPSRGSSASSARQSVTKGGRNATSAGSDSGKSAARKAVAGKTSGAAPSKAPAPSISSHHSKQAPAKASTAPKPEKAAPTKASSTGSKAVEARKDAPRSTPTVKAAAPAGIAKNPRASDKKVN